MNDKRNLNEPNSRNGQVLHKKEIHDLLYPLQSNKNSLLMRSKEKPAEQLANFKWVF